MAGSLPEDLEVRLSLPNWVDIPEGAGGRAHYKQAARVACHIFASDREAWMRNPRPTLHDWRSLVGQFLKELGISDASPADPDKDGDPQGFRKMLENSIPCGGGVSFRFVSESSAAGLAGLRRVESGEEKRGLKLLVIDVGAGSTDIGYVIRTVLSKEEEVEERLIQLPPANTCQTAGNALTDSIVGIYRGRGKPITRDEAETIKTTGVDSEWLTDPSVDDWARSIANHVHAYMLGISDKRWLPYPPGLQILITGGSGVVPGLREKIASAVAQALRERRVTGDVIDMTKPMSLLLEGPGAKEANRLAVALGAADRDLPKLWYTPKIDPPMLRPTVKMPPSFTGS